MSTFSIEEEEEVRMVDRKDVYEGVLRDSHCEVI
jgi:hypothetical protein